MAVGVCGVVVWEIRARLVGVVIAEILVRLVVIGWYLVVWWIGGKGS